MKVQLIEQVLCDASKDIFKKVQMQSILWEYKKFWQSQLFTNTHE